jgi:hypothetical protein
MLDGLAFVPVNEVKDGMTYLRQNIPSGAEPIVDYFDETYVNGKSRDIVTTSGAVITRHIEPMFPIEQWNVYDVTRDGEKRTNNDAEGWNNRFRSLLGHPHSTPFKVIEALQRDAAIAIVAIRKMENGDLESKYKLPTYVKYSKKLKELCDNYAAGHRSLPDFLAAISHNLRFRIDKLNLDDSLDDSFED